MPLQSLWCWDMRTDRVTPPRKLRSRFKSELYTKSGEYALLLRDVGLIRKVVRKTELELNRRAQISLWQSLLRGVGLVEPAARPDEVRVQYSMEATLTETELRELIAGWTEDDSRTEWDDIGFVMSGDASKVHWLNRSIARDDFELDVSRDNAEMVNPQSLLDELYRFRTSLLSAIA